MAGTGPTYGYVGREPELERLARRLGQTVDGGGGMVALRGPSGIGVTRTAHEVAARADRLGMLTLWGQTIDGLGSRPFGGLADALEEFATSLPPQTLRTTLGAGAPALARLCPRLRDVMPDIPPAAPLEAADERLRLYDAITTWLKNAATEAPILFVLDDWQWADDDTRSLVDHVGTHLRAAPVLLLTTESLLPGTEPRPAGEGVDVVDIEGLDEGALATLLGDLAERPLPRASLEAIHEVSAGHPLFARELVRHLSEEGRLSGTQTLTATELPQTFEQVMTWRISRMPLETRTVLSALSCFPTGAAPGLLTHVTGMARARLVEVIERGLSAGLIRLTERGQRYALYHDRVRAALIVSTPARTRAAVHRRAAEGLEAELGDDVRAHAPELVDHLVAATLAEPASAGDGRAVRHLLVAAEQARAAYAHQRAASLLGYAVVAFGEGRRTDYAELVARRAVAQAEAGQIDVAVRSLRELISGQRRHGSLTREAWSDIVGAIRVIRYGDEVATAASLARAALDEGSVRDETLKRRLRLLTEEWAPVEIAGIHSLAWRVDESDAASILAERGDEADRSDVHLAQRPRTPAESGQLTIAIANWRRPASTLRGMYAATSDLLTRLGHFRAGAAMAGRYLASAERFGSLRDIYRALLLLSRARAALGELAAAAEIIAAADGLSARIPAPSEFAVERLAAELTLAHYVDTDWPVAVARIAKSRAEQVSAWGIDMAAEHALAATRAGAQAEARDLAAAVLQAVTETPPLTFGRDSAMFTTLTSAWEAGAAENAYEGRALLDRAVSAGAGGNHTATPRVALARLHALSGNVDEAREHFARERARLESGGLRPLRAITDYDEAITIAAAGTGYPEAGALLEQAFAAFHGLGMTGWARRAESLQAKGFEAAAQPGGRLFFSYPVGLSRREVDVVRRLAGGQTSDEVARALEVDTATIERHLTAAMEKLGSASLDELPRYARRHGLGGV